MVLLDKLERTHGVLAGFSKHLPDECEPLRTTHSIEKLIKQRIFLQCWGYEDRNDSDEVAHDPILQESFGSIARYDGVQWKDVGGGIGWTHHLELDTLNNFMYGSVGGIIFRWDGYDWKQLSWSAIGDSVPGGRALGFYHGELYSSGCCPVETSTDTFFHVARWNGEQWQGLAEGTDHELCQ